MTTPASVQPLPSDIRAAYIRVARELRQIDQQIDEMRRCMNVLHKYASKRVAAPPRRRSGVPLYIAKHVTPTPPLLIPVQQITARIPANRRPLLVALALDLPGRPTAKAPPKKTVEKRSKKRGKAFAIAQV